MKKALLSFLVLLVLLTLGACQGMSDFKDQFFADVSGLRKFEPVDPDTFDQAGRQALMVLDAAKSENLRSFPYVRVDSQSKIRLNNKTDYSRFSRESMVIVAYEQNVNGTNVLDTVDESLDDLGRIDLSRNRIVFRPRTPDKNECAAIKKSLLKGAQAIKGLDKELAKIFKEIIAEYQRGAGLAPDGVAGKNTVGSLSQKMLILDIQELSTDVAYSWNPKHKFYILAHETVKQNPEKFNQGFKSMEEVAKHAISPDKFKEIAKRGQKFVLFVYFLDRVDPLDSIRIGFSDIAKRRMEKSMTARRYVLPKKWPVLVEAFKIDERPKVKFFVNIFVRGRCVASHRLK